MANRPFYTLLATPSGIGWAIDVPEIVGCHGTAAEQSEIESIGLDLVATMLDTEPDSFDLVITLNRRG